MVRFRRRTSIKPRTVVETLMKKDKYSGVLLRFLPSVKVGVAYG
jgi:hypothetical protein